MYAYTPEELAGIEAQHNEGRLMPFIELPLIGGQWIVRFIREGDHYVAKLTAKDATMFLSGINSACALHDVATMNLSHGNVSTEAAQTNLPPYGYCPYCWAEGYTRERRPDGNDVCTKGHSYPSKSALKSL